MHNISSKYDDSGVALGRKYARTDELGIPFGITIDADTLEDDTVTLRERDSMQQVRIKVNKPTPINLCHGYSLIILKRLMRFQKSSTLWLAKSGHGRT